MGGCLNESGGRDYTSRSAISCQISFRLLVFGFLLFLTADGQSLRAYFSHLTMTQAAVPFA